VGRYRKTARRAVGKFLQTIPALPIRACIPDPAMGRGESEQRFMSIGGPSMQERHAAASIPCAR
jgi:hypothetical protein